MVNVVIKISLGGRLVNETSPVSSLIKGSTAGSSHDDYNVFPRYRSLDLDPFVIQSVWFIQCLSLSLCVCVWSKVNVNHENVELK